MFCSAATYFVQAMDRSILKLLSLPFFFPECSDVLLLLGLFTVELFVALRASSMADVQRRLAQLAPVMIKRTTGDVTEQQLEAVTRQLENIALLWHFVMASKDTFLQDTARLAGFGGVHLRMIDDASSSASRGSMASKRTRLAKALPGPTRPRSTEASLLPEAAQVTPLMEQELASKRRWILRLEAIARHAGANAAFNDVREDELLLTVDEAAS